MIDTISVKLFGKFEEASQVKEAALLLRTGDVVQSMSHPTTVVGRVYPQLDGKTTTWHVVAGNAQVASVDTSSSTSVSSGFSLQLNFEDQPHAITDENYKTVLAYTPTNAVFIHDQKVLQVTQRYLVVGDDAAAWILYCEAFNKKAGLA